LPAPAGEKCRALSACRIFLAREGFLDMTTPLRLCLSHCVGWAADRRIPKPLRAPIYKLYARFTGADLGEVRMPLAEHPSLAAFFVRRLVDGARPITNEPKTIASPVDGTVQSVCTIASGSILQAKGRSYSVSELCAGEDRDLALEGGTAWTIYLSPRDYHRIHAPETCALRRVRWIPGARHSVAPSVLARRMVLPINERAVLRLDTQHGTLLLVLVGALNVGRIRVVGVERGDERDLVPPPRFARGAELARFEMGSTIVLIAPAHAARPRTDLVVGQALRLGEAIGEVGNGGDGDGAPRCASAIDDARGDANEIESRPRSPTTPRPR
jgi:phosphatidylserine decarboxylase